MRRDKLQKLINDLPEKDKLKRAKLQELRQQIDDLSAQMQDSIRTCNHVIVKDDDTGMCLICDIYTGWFCEHSPNKYCEYSEDDVCMDSCIYCYEPYERK